MIQVNETHIYDPNTGLSHYRAGQRIEVCSAHAPDGQNAGCVISDDVDRVWTELGGNLNATATQQLADLREAAEYARSILGAIPAFGDSIGENVTKAQIGTARAKLNTALNEIRDAK